MTRKLAALLSLVFALPCAAAADPHYNDAGFFDVRVCNWPEKPQFMMALFSTERFNEVQRVSVYSQQDRHIGDLDLNKFREFRTKDGTLKRAFITHFEFADGDGDGWYRADIALKDGSRYQAKDYVVVVQMAHPTDLEPAPGAEGIPMPTHLRWAPVPGARYYQVYIRDKWDDTLVYSSKAIRENELQLPEGLLQPGGYYSWRIHSRDSNGNVLLGDFNHGSLNAEASFTIAD